MKKIMIIAVFTAGLFFTGCGTDENQSKETQKTVVKQAKVINNTIKTEAVKEKTTKTDQKTKEFDQEHNITGKTKIAIVAVKQKTKEVVTKATTPNAEVLYKKCAGCHGTHGEKKALGASQIIQGWDATKVSQALHGYQDGSYGSTMKGVMAGQAKSLSNADISALAEYISKIK